MKRRLIYLVVLERYKAPPKTAPKTKEIVSRTGVLDVCVDLDEAIKSAAREAREARPGPFKLCHYAAERPYWRDKHEGLEIMVQDFGLNETRCEPPCGKQPSSHETARPCELPRGHSGMCAPFHGRCEYRGRDGARCRRRAGHGESAHEWRHLFLRVKVANAHE